MREKKIQGGCLDSTLYLGHRCRPEVSGIVQAAKRMGIGSLCLSREDILGMRVA